MEKKSEILEELKQWQSPLAEIPRRMPFMVPEHYFSTLQESITISIQTEATPLQWTDRTPYALPENYFNTLPQDIMAKAKQSEKTQPKKKTIALPFFVKAAAAVLVMTLSIAGYRYFSTEQLITSEQLAQLPTEDINTWLEQNNNEVNTDLPAYDAAAIDMGSLEDIDSETIVDYLDEDGWYVTKK